MRRRTSPDLLIIAFLAEWGKWAKSGFRALFPGELDAASNGLRNFPGNAAAAHPISREISREIGSRAIPRKFPGKLDAQPRLFPGNFAGRWPPRPISREIGSGSQISPISPIRPFGEIPVGELNFVYDLKSPSYVIRINT